MTTTRTAVRGSYMPLFITTVLWFWLVAAVHATETKTWILSHSFSTPPKFSPRAHIVLTIDDNNAVSWTVEDQVELTKQDVQDLQRHGWYQLELKEEKSSVPAVRTSVPACTLRRANFRDELVLMLSSNTAQVLSLDYIPKLSPLAPPSCDDLAVADATFETSIDYQMDTPGMTLKTILPQYSPPPGLKYLKTSGSTSTKPPPGLGKGGEAGKEEEEPPDTSFFGFLKRYWYVFLPLVLSNVLGGSGGQEQQQQQQPSGQGQPQQGTAGTAGSSPAVQAAPAASSSSGGGGTAPRQRRGKRG